MTPMMNNPVTLIYNEMQRGADVLTALDRVATQYPQMFPRTKVMQAKALLGGKSQADLHQIVQNMARERGITLESILRSMGVQIPSDR